MRHQNHTDLARPDARGFALMRWLRQPPVSAHGDGGALSGLQDMDDTRLDDLGLDRARLMGLSGQGRTRAATEALRHHGAALLRPVALR